MLSKQESKGLARWKPLFIMPLALALVLAFAESRTIVKSDPAAAPTSVQSGQEDAGKGGVKPGTQAEEDMIKALKEKAAQLEDMKTKNTETVSKLKQKLEATTDPETKAKIMAMMKEQKILSLELGAKERMLQMKKLELTMAKEGDAAKKADMEKKLQVLKAQSEEYLKKADDLRKAEEKAKAGSEKK